MLSTAVSASSGSGGKVSSQLKVDPSTLVDGVTRERIDRDPVLAEFMQANFPDAFELDESDEDPMYAQMRAMGYSMDPPDSYAGKKKKHEKKNEIKAPRNIRPLTSYLRDTLREEGTHNSRKLRSHEDLIPGLLYGSDPTQGILSQDPSSKISVKTPWNLLKGELDRYRYKFESRVYDLTVLEHPEDETGTVYRVTPQDVNRHPIKETIYCCNFLRYHPERPLKIPFNFINTEDSPALKRDGFVVPINRFVECFIEDGADIPEAIDVECTGVRFREVIRVDRLLLPDGVTLSDRVLKQKRRFIVGVVFGGSKGADEEEEEGETKGEEKKETAAASAGGGTGGDSAAAKKDRAASKK